MPKKVLRIGTFETNSSSMHSICVTKNEREYTQGEIMEGIWLSEDGTIRLCLNDLVFGRSPFEILCTFIDKVRYAIAEYCADQKIETAYKNDKMIRKIVKKYIPGFKSFAYDTKDVDIYVDEEGNDILKEDMEYAGNGFYRYTANGISYENISFAKNPTRFERELYGFEKGKTYPEGFFYQVDGKTHFAKMDRKNILEVPLFGSIDHQSAGMLKRFIQKHGITLEEFLIGRQYVIIVDGDEYMVFDRAKAAGIIDRDNIREEFRW